MSRNQMVGLFFGLYWFMLMLAVAVDGARRKDWPETPPIGTPWSSLDKRSRAARAWPLGFGYALLLSPVIMVAVQPWAQRRLSIWHMILLGSSAYSRGRRSFG
jgi:hypothetical protein